MRAGIVLLLLVTAAAGLLRAQSWILKIPGQGLGNPLAANPLNSDILYTAAGGNRVYVSRDRGYTWANFGALVPGGGIIKSVSVSPLDTLKILAGVESSVGFPDRIMRSTDGGMNWAETWSGTFSYYGQPVETTPAHPDTVYTMGLDTLYRSVDFGATWDTVCTGKGFNAWCDASLRPDSAGVMYLGDNLSGIWKTRDGGSSWRKVYSTIGEIPSIAIDPLNPRVAYAGKFGGGGGIVKTTDWGETWHTLIVPSGNRDTWWVTCSPVHPGYVYYGTYTGDTTNLGIYISRDSGATWSKISSGIGQGAYFNYGLLALDSLTLLALQSNGVYKYQYPVSIDVLQPDGGEYWLSDSVEQITWAAAGLYSVKLEYSLDHGSSWTEIADSVNASPGSYPWTVPAAYSESCLVRVSDALFTATAATSAAPFTITNAYLTVVSPNGGESWDAGSVGTVSWSSVSFDSLRIDYSTDSGATWNYVTRVPAEANAFAWMVPDDPTTAALIRLQGTDDTNVVDLSDAVFTISSPDEFSGGIVVDDAGAGIDTLRFGLIAGATDSIDAALGESELGPLPPAGTFDARWYLGGTNGLEKDYRDTFAGPSDLRVYRALLQPGPGGYPLTLTWEPESLRTGTLVMRDRMTSGGLNSVNMRLTGALVVQDPSVGELEIVHCPGTSVTIPGDGAWKLFSLPVETGDRRAASLFPFSPSGAYEYRNGYIGADTLRHGTGYWIKTEQVSLTGCPVAGETVAVRKGWNILGAPTDAIGAATVVSDPESLTVSPWYGYGPGGYFPTDSLLPGEGYWIKCRDSGLLVIGSPPGARFSSAALPVSPFKVSGVDRVSRLVLRAAGGQASTLFFGPDHASISSWEVPPPPPGQSAQSAFKGGEIGVFHDASPKYPIEYEIILNSVQNEIFFSWAVEIQENLEYILVEKRADRDVSATLLQGSGTGISAAAPGSKFFLRIVPRGTRNSGTPTEYALGEWYPNPFNPSTRARLTLPFESSVSYTVYNSLGEAVSSTASVRRDAGEHILEWKAARNDGTPLGSGVYFIALDAIPVDAGGGAGARSFREVKKVVLLR